MDINKQRPISKVERFSIQATRWIGSIESLIGHSIFFAGIFSLAFFGVAIEKILLIVTTIVSYEAIYLSIFIQMSVNRQARKLKAVARDVEDIQENVEEIQEDVEGIEKDVEDIQENVEEIQEDVEGIEKDVDEIQKDVEGIEEDVGDISEEIVEDEDEPTVKKDNDIVLERIEYTLSKLMKDIEELKKAKKK